jgi:hypothetical protein
MGSRAPLPVFAGLGRDEQTKVTVRSDAGKGGACGTTLTLAASRLDLGPLFAAQAREERER